MRKKEDLSGAEVNTYTLTSLKQLSTAAPTKEMPNEGCSDNSSGMRAKFRNSMASFLLQNTNSGTASLLMNG